MQNLDSQFNEGKKGKIRNSKEKLGIKEKQESYHQFKQSAGSIKHF